MSKPDVQDSLTCPVIWREEGPERMANLRIESILCVFLCLYICGLVGAITLPGNHDVYISGPVIAPNGNSFSLSCNCIDFMKSVYQMNPSFSDSITVDFFSEGTKLESVNFNPGGLTCDANLVFGQGGNQDRALNSNISCSVSANVNKPGLPPQPAVSTSDEMYLGFTVERNPMIVKEGETQTLKVISNVPILCQNTPDCCVTLNLKIPSNKNNIAAISKCNYEMCTSSWDVTKQQAVVEIPLVANKDPADDIDKDMTVSFDPLTPVSGGQVHQLLTNLKIPDIDVKLPNEPYYVCTLTGDPHIHPFEDLNSVLHVYEIGEFLFYSNPDHDIEIHGKTWPCNNRASCVCGMIIRQGREVIRVSICDEVRLPRYMRNRPYRERMNYVIGNSRMTLKVPDGGLPDGATVFMDREDRYMQVNFASGFKVEVKHPHNVALYAKVTAPPTHAQGLSGRGLCGTPGQNFTGILQKGDGTITVCQQRRRGCHNVDYNESWRLRAQNSMFHTPPNVNKVSTQGQDLCTCANPSTAPTATINCDFSGNQPVKLKDCQHCTSVTTLPPGLFGGTFRIDFAAAVVSGFVATNKRAVSANATGAVTAVATGAVAANATAGVSGNITNSGNLTNDQNSTDYFTFLDDEYIAEFPEYLAAVAGATHPQITVTEETARQMCTRAIEASVMIGLCRHMDQVFETSVEECIDDYLVTNEKDMLEASVHAFNMLCQIQLEKDPANYETGADGVQELRDAVTVRSTCSQTCSAHGVCQSGTCVCDQGWEGNHCAVNLNASNATTPFGQITTTTAVVNTTPQPSAAPQMCDVTNGNCTKANISPPLGTSPGDFVVCRFESSVQSDVVTSGVINKVGNCACQLPKLNVGRNIGLAYVEMTIRCEAGGKVGPPYPFTVYDPLCVDSALNQNAHVCIIDYLCYEDGVINPANDYEGCSPVQSMTSWTAVTHKMLKPSEIELTLSGPDPMTIMMSCAVPSPATADMTVDWLINGATVRSQTLAAGEDHVETLLLDFIDILLGTPGKLSCQIEDNSVSPPRKMVSEGWTIV